MMNDLQNFKWLTLVMLLVCSIDGFSIDPPSEKKSENTEVKSMIHSLDEEDDDCDTCSGGSTGDRVNFGTFSGTNFIGLRYVHQSFSSKEGLFANSPKIDENYNTVLLTASSRIGDRFGVTLALPYQFHYRNYESQTADKSINGLGDLAAYGFYNVFSKEHKAVTKGTSLKKPTKKDSVNYSHNVVAGLGIKLPTGDFEAVTNNNLNPGFQLGSGSVDIAAVASYTYKHNSLGFNTSVNYFFKTENKNDYQFGNQLNAGVVGFKKYTTDKRELIPFAGLSFEQYANNKQYGELVTPENGGSILYSKLGGELAFDKISFGVNANLPVYQNLKLDNFESNWRGSVFVNYGL